VPSVSNYNIENASGANVRTDINNVLGAVQSNNSEGSDLSASQCVAGMWFYHNSDQEIKIRNSANNDFTVVGKINEDNLGLLPKAGGTLTGVLKIDGTNSASNPPLTFNGDPDLGLFRKAANQLGIASNGVEQLFVDTNGITLNNQRELRLSEPTTAGTQYVGFKAPDTLAANVVWKLPNADTAVNGYALISDGNGNLSWGQAGSGAQGGSTNRIFWENDQTVTANYTISNGQNAGSFGPITIQSGVTVTVGDGETWSIV
tara:strand:- start:1837 stop:2616 length:780 start_codon:yes stop_codon:yes gene_type:complete